MAKKFADEPQPTDEERAIEIGTIHAAALAYGLNDVQVMRCYNTAYIAAKNSLK